MAPIRTVENKGAFETLGLEMRTAEGLNKIKVFGVAFFSALAALFSAPAALCGVNIFKHLVISAYPSNNERYTARKATESPYNGHPIEVPNIENKDKSLTLAFDGHDVQVCRSDILASGASIIVNPANIHLYTSGNGGLNAAIINAGGDGYKASHDKLRKQQDGHFEPGDAAILPSGNLNEKGIKNVIVVAPPNRRGKTDPVTDEEKRQLFACYYNALLLAHEAKHESIAIPSLGTGINKFPPDIGAQICKDAIHAFYTNYGESELKITIYARAEDEFNTYRMGRLLPTIPPSSVRTIRDTLIGLPQKALQAAQSLFAEVNVDESKFSRLRETLPKAQGEAYISLLEKIDAIRHLRQNSQLGFNTVNQFADSLSKPENPFNYHPEFTFDPAGSPELPNFEDAHIGELSIFPIGLDESFRKHWVIVVIDPKNHTIELYDPKGISIEDHASTRLHSYPNHTLKTLMNKIALHYTGQYPADDWRVGENTNRHQTDAYNCGVYICNYMRRRVAGESAQGIQENGLTFREASGAERSLMANSILDSCEKIYPISNLRADLSPKSEVLEFD